jgi:hypothetical protein
MADQVTAQDKGQSFIAHAEGTGFASVCADVIDLGARVEMWPGQPTRIVDKVALVYRTDTEGETKDIAFEASVSMNERAKLRGLLEKWRGKSYTDAEAKKGVPLDKLVGHGALLSVEHKTSGKGRVYAVISSIAPLPKQMDKPVLDGYVRAKFWEERKAAYKAEATKWATAQVEEEDYDKLSGDDPDAIPF